MKLGGFVDLRLNDETSGQESFWPSFTDIMTVIVIIFMLVMVTLLLKNMDLVDQLRISLALERTATEQVNATSDINIQLHQRIQQSEQESAELRKHLMTLSDKHRHTLKQLNKNLSSLAQQRDITLSEKAVLERSKAALEINKTALEKSHILLQQNQIELIEQLAQRSQALNESQDILKVQQVRLDATQSELDNKRIEFNNKKTELESNQIALETNKRALVLSQRLLKQHQNEVAVRFAQHLKALADQQHLYALKVEEMSTLELGRGLDVERIKKLELEYASLASKYKRLIRPARSELGKVVAFVRYRKLDDKLNIELKLPAGAHYFGVDGIALHKYLAALQDKHGKALYVRIIFPDDSNLSQAEAWSLTESLLNLYDYYYQK